MREVTSLFRRELASHVALIRNRTLPNDGVSLHCHPEPAKTARDLSYGMRAFPFGERIDWE